MTMQSERSIAGFARGGGFARVNAPAVARRQLKASLGLVGLLAAAIVFTAAIGRKSDPVAAAKAPAPIHQVFKVSPRV